jgi:hypothetical protein
MAFRTRRNKDVRFDSTDRAAEPMMMMMMKTVTFQYVVRNSKRGYFLQEV